MRPLLLTPQLKTPALHGREGGRRAQCRQFYVDGCGHRGARVNTAAHVIGHQLQLQTRAEQYGRVGNTTLRMGAS